MPSIVMLAGRALLVTAPGRGVGGSTGSGGWVGLFCTSSDDNNGYEKHKANAWEIHCGFTCGYSDGIVTPVGCVGKVRKPSNAEHQQVTRNQRAQVLRAGVKKTGTVASLRAFSIWWTTSPSWAAGQSYSGTGQGGSRWLDQTGRVPNSGWKKRAQPIV